MSYKSALEASALYHNTTPEKVKSRNRLVENARARFMWAYAMKKFGGCSYAIIARVRS